MGVSIQQLRERRAAKAVEARKLMDETKDSKWTSEHQSKYDELTGEVVALDQKIEREQKLIDLMAEDHEKEDHAKKAHDKKKLDALSPEGIFNAWARGGEKSLSQEQAQALYNTMSTTTGSEGGFTVPTTVATRLIELLKSFGGVRAVAEILTMQSGNPMSFPTTDGSAEEGEIIAENATATASDPTFGTVGLPVYKFSSKIMAVPIELLQDSVIDVESFINRRAAERLGRITNRLYTVGTGTSQPMGIVTASTVGKAGATGTTTTFGYDDLVDVMEAVDDAYTEGGRGQWMFSQAVRRVLRKMKDTAGRPIWTPGYEFGTTAGVPDLLLGANVRINNQMAVPAANARSIVFGDLSKYVIRDSLQVSLFRFADSPYITKGQIGFLAWMRTGGNLTDTSAVKHFQHSAT